MTMRGSLEGADTTRSARPISQDIGGIAENVIAGTAGLPVSVLLVPTVVILSDVRFLREALAEILAREAELAVIGTAANIGEAQTSWSNIDPDMVLLDTTLPDALAAVALIRAMLPKTRVIALAMAETEENVIKWGAAGVASYIPRIASMADVIAAIGNTMRGEQSCSTRISAALLHRLSEHPARSSASDQPVLSAREVEIVRLLASGLSNKEIAARLHISLATTKSHVHNILTKLDLRRRGHTASWLRQNAAALADFS